MELRIKLIGDYTPGVRAHTASPQALELVIKREGKFRVACCRGVGRKRSLGRGLRAAAPDVFYDGC